MGTEVDIKDIHDRIDDALDRMNACDKQHTACLAETDLRIERISMASEAQQRSLSQLEGLVDKAFEQIRTNACTSRDNQTKILHALELVHDHGQTVNIVRSEMQPVINRCAEQARIKAESRGFWGGIKSNVIAAVLVTLILGAITWLSVQVLSGLRDVMRELKERPAAAAPASTTSTPSTLP